MKSVPLPTRGGFQSFFPSEVFIIVLKESKMRNKSLEGMNAAFIPRFGMSLRLGGKMGSAVNFTPLYHGAIKHLDVL